MWNMNGFTINDTLFENVIKILPIIYQTKLTILNKNKKLKVQLWEEEDFISYAQAI